MSKEFEIITEDMWEKAHNYHNSTPRDYLNQLVIGKGQVGYIYHENNANEYWDDICSSISSKKHEKDTHQALVFTRPIEEEKVDCKHDYMWCTNADIKGDSPMEVHQVIYCPKCGQKLKEID